MIFVLELLGPRRKEGPAVIEKRTHAGASVVEAARTAKDMVLNTAPEGTYGFRLLDQNGVQVHIWYNGEDHA